MANKYPLTEGCLCGMLKGETIEDPIVQVLGSKRIASINADKDRFRLLLSDGKHMISFAMLTTQIKHKGFNGELADNTIIKIKRYLTSLINNCGKGSKNVLVILDMEVLVPGKETEKIGDPETLSESDMAVDTTSTSTSTSSSITNGHSDNQSNSITSSHVDSSSKPTPTPYSNTNGASNVDLNVSLQDHLTHPISSLSPYQNKWVIKARVANKSGIRQWSNSRGEGKLFSMDLVDESGEIRCTAFRDLVDKYYDKIEVDKIYYISKAQIKVANKQFNNLKNDYEITLTNDTVIQECHETVTSIPRTKYDFLSIDKIANLDTGIVIDVIGICKATSDLQTFTAKSSGRELKKREVTLVDQSKSGISLTLWGNDAEKFDGSSHPVIAIKGAKIGEFGGGKNLSIFSSSLFKINPDIPESHRLKGWFENGGMQQHITNISAKTGTGNYQTPWLSFKEVQELVTPNAEKGDYFQAKATVLLFRSENCLYKACPTDDCNKKVVDQGDDVYKCEKCNKTFTNFKYRLIGQMNVGDWSGNLWVSMFASEAEKVLGMSSKDVGNSVENDPECIAEIADNANFKQFIIKCRAKVESWSDEQRLRTVVVKVNDINYKEYNAHLISRINQLLGE